MPAAVTVRGSGPHPTCPGRGTPDHRPPAGEARPPLSAPDSCSFEVGVAAKCPASWAWRTGRSERRAHLSLPETPAWRLRHPRTNTQGCHPPPRSSGPGQPSASMQQQLELRVPVPEAPGPTDIGLRQGQSPRPASRPGVPGSGWDSPHFPLAARPTLGTVPHCSLTQDSPAPQGAGPGGEQMRPLAPWLVRQGWWLVFAGQLNPPTGLSTGSGKRRLGLRTGPRDASLGGSCVHPTSGPSCAPAPDRTGGPREGGFGQVRVMVGKSRAELPWPDVWAPPPQGWACRQGRAPCCYSPRLPPGRWPRTPKGSSSILSAASCSSSHDREIAPRVKSVSGADSNPRRHPEAGCVLLSVICTSGPWELPPLEF